MKVYELTWIMHLKDIHIIKTTTPYLDSFCSQLFMILIKQSILDTIQFIMNIQSTLRSIFILFVKNYKGELDLLYVGFVDNIEDDFIKPLTTQLFCRFVNKSGMTNIHAQFGGWNILILYSM